MATQDLVFFLSHMLIGFAWVAWRGTVFFRGFIWKLFLVKHKPGQEDTTPDKLPYFKWSLAAHPSKYFFISHVPQLILESKCSVRWSSQTSPKQVFPEERKQVIGLLFGWRAVLQAVSILPSTRNVSFPSESIPSHHHRRRTTGGVVMSLPHSALSAHTNAACSLAFLSYPQKKSDTFELHLWDRPRPQALAQYWYEMTGLIVAAWERNPAQLSRNRVYSFSCGWVQVCSSSPGLGAHGLERQRISHNPLNLMPALLLSLQF